MAFLNPALIRFANFPTPITELPWKRDIIDCYLTLRFD